MNKFFTNEGIARDIIKKAALNLTTFDYDLNLMRNLHLFAVIIVVLLISACKKNADNKNSVNVTISGTVYPIVTIGKQQWTTVNYYGPGGKDLTLPHPNDNYKKYYTLDDVENLALPRGWRIPTKDDFNKLLSNYSQQQDSLGNFVGDVNVAVKLMSTSGWYLPYDSSTQGTNESGFNGYPAGYYVDPRGIDIYPGYYAWFLTSTALPANMVTFRANYYTFIISNLFGNTSTDDKTRCYSCLPSRTYNDDAAKSVRFVRDL
ncbi:MAG: hypothetical protein M3O71_16115 [Bacteroidota bacterium]|nr:hypothetical protein [Bacteroidota bacterium]